MIKHKITLDIQWVPNIAIGRADFISRLTDIDRSVIGKFRIHCLFI